MIIGENFKMIRKLLLGISLSLAFLLTSCEDKVAEEKLVVDNFGIGHHNFGIGHRNIRINFLYPVKWTQCRWI